MKILITDVLNKTEINTEITVCGWVRTIRKQRDITFIALNDGSSFANLQIIVNKDIELSPECSVGASIRVEGKIVESPAKGQRVELIASKIHLYGGIPNAKEYPLAKKRHTLEYLRGMAHLRPRTNTFGAVTRVRNTCAKATHDFFQKGKYKYIHTPLITSSDCEGAGETFNVTTDYTEKFFDKDAYLTVSGQLNVESYCCALGNVYTFGPTFRAEKSHTNRHLAEFWMIEPEIAFAELPDVMEVAEAYVKYCIIQLLDENREDLEFFQKMYSDGLIEHLETISTTKFIRLTYTEAVEQLQGDFPDLKWGDDLNSDQEKLLASKIPVFVYDYPREIKSFYMKDNEDGKTVGATDLLVPGIGELIGGSVREDDYDKLLSKMQEYKMDIETYQWYLDLRKYGSIPHGGFGLGFERLLLLVTGMTNIRDVIPFPRAPGGLMY